jgi:hypothetical protein
MKSKQYILISIVLLFGHLNIKSQTIVGGIIYNSDTWTMAGNPYYVAMDLTIWPDVTLKIDSGVQIYMKKNFGIHIYGKLKVKGTKQLPVVFDGDSLGSGFNVLWQGIKAMNDTCSIELEHARFRHAEAALNLTRIQGDRFKVYPSINVNHCLFFDNLAAIRSSTNMAKGTVKNCKFVHNQLGIDGTGILAETSNFYQLTHPITGPGYSIYVENCLFDGNKIAAAGLSFIKKCEFKRNETAIKFVSNGSVDSSVFSWNRLAIRGHSYLMRGNGFYNNDTAVLIYGEPNPPKSFSTVLLNGSTFDKNNIGLLVQPNSEINQIACNRFTRNKKAIQVPAYTYLDNGVRNFSLLTSFFTNNDTAIYITSDSSVMPNKAGFRLVYFNTTDCFFNGGDYYAYNSSNQNLNFFHNIFTDSVKSEEDYLHDVSDDNTKGAFNYAEQNVITLYDTTKAYYYYKYSRAALVLKHNRYVSSDTIVYFPSIILKPCSDPSLKHQSKLNKLSHSNGIKMYPNPCYTELTIELDGLNFSKINIYSTSGQTVYSNILNSENPDVLVVPTNQLPPGVYIIIIQTKDGFVNAKFVKG